MGGTVYRLPIIPNVEGDYTNPSISIDRYGRVTQIISGSGGSGDGVPYVGATGHVDLGTYYISASSGGFDTVLVGDGIDPTLLFGQENFIVTGSEALSGLYYGQNIGAGDELSAEVGVTNYIIRRTF